MEVAFYATPGPLTALTREQVDSVRQLDATTPLDQPRPAARDNTDEELKLVYAQLTVPDEMLV